MDSSSIIVGVCTVAGASIGAWAALRTAADDFRRTVSNEVAAIEARVNGHGETLKVHQDALQKLTQIAYELKGIIRRQEDDRKE